MKRDFFDLMYELMEHKDIYLIFVGLGYPRYDEFKKKFKDRAINTEASEQTALDIAVGLAYSNKIPFVYTITPFFLRGWETIRTYIAYENLNVKLIGAGRYQDYSLHDGFSHDATDIYGHMKLLGISQYYPNDKKELEDNLKKVILNKCPEFISVRK